MTVNEFEKLSSVIKRAPLGSIFIANHVEVVRDLADEMNRYDLHIRTRETMLHDGLFEGTDLYYIVDPTIKDLTYQELQFIAKATAHNDKLMRDSLCTTVESEQSDSEITCRRLAIVSLGVIIAFAVYLIV